MLERSLRLLQISVLNVTKDSAVVESCLAPCARAQNTHQMETLPDARTLIKKSAFLHKISFKYSPKENSEKI